jgi:hypothetical protein
MPMARPSTPTKRRRRGVLIFIESIRLSETGAEHHGTRVRV